MTAYSLAELESFTRADLLAIYNQYADRPLKSFKDHATAVQRTGILLGVLDADEEAPEQIEDGQSEDEGTYTAQTGEDEPAAVLAASDDEGPDYLDLSDEKAERIALAASDKYDPTSEVNIQRAAKYGFISAQAYCDAVQAKHTYRKAVTAGAANVKELEARWKALERAGKGRKAKA